MSKWNNGRSVLVDQAAAAPGHYRRLLNVLANLPIEECLGWAGSVYSVIDAGTAPPAYQAVALRIHAHAMRRVGTMLALAPDADAMKVQAKKAGLFKSDMFFVLKLAAIPDDVFSALVDCEQPATVEELLKLFPSKTKRARRKQAATSKFHDKGTAVSTAV